MDERNDGRGFEDGNEFSRSSVSGVLLRAGGIAYSKQNGEKEIKWHSKPVTESCDGVIEYNTGVGTRP